MDVTIPEDLTTLDDAALTELRDNLVAEFDRLYDEDTQDLATLNEIATALRNVRGEIDKRDAAAEEAAAERARLRDEVHGAEATDDTDTGDTDDDDDPDDDDADTADDTTDTTDTADDTAGDNTAEQAEEKVPVTAGAAPKAVRRSRPRPAIPERAENPVTIIAAADVPGYATGARLSGKLDIAKAMHEKARNLSDHSQPLPVARVQRPIPEDHYVDRQPGPSDLAVLDRVASADRLLRDGALVAAGGFCTPSENLYEFFKISSADNLLDVPRVGTRRGGLNIPGFMGIDMASTGLWVWTEENDITPTDPATKPCVRIACPEWTDYRLTAYGVCVTHGNLMDRSFPELTTGFVDTLMDAHAHRLSGVKVNAIAATATAVAIAAGVSSAASEILSAVGLQMADYRSQHKMGDSVVLDSVFPLWTLELMRADLAMRNGVDLLSVSDAQIRQWFADRKTRVQFVEDYQPLYDAAPKTAWPTSLKFLMYPAGGYVEGNGGVIDLGVQRDSTLNETNDFTAAWSEELLVIGQRGPDAREVTVTILVDGVTACCPTAAA